MKFLLDTHVLLWASGFPERLSEDARALIEAPGTDPVFSAASLWEVAIKNGLGRADFEVDPRVLHRELLANGYAEPLPPRLRLVESQPEERYVTCVPLVSLKAAAGAFSDPQYVDDEDFTWAAVETGRRLRPGMFVAQVVGRSMEPAIPDGAYCLFAAPVEGTRQGKTVLVQMRGAADPESGERYTVKRYESEKVAEEDSWQHTRITLTPVNPEFEPIVLTGTDQGTL